MKIIEVADLEKYKCILSLPGYKVWENTNTFHMVVVHQKPRTKHPERMVVCAEGFYPGLADDPPITIPAGMFREIVKKIGKNQPLLAPEGLFDRVDIPQPPQPRRRDGGAEVNPRLQQLFRGEAIEQVDPQVLAQQGVNVAAPVFRYYDNARIEVMINNQINNPFGEPYNAVEAPPERD